MIDLAALLGYDSPGLKSFTTIVWESLCTKAVSLPSHFSRLTGVNTD